MKNYTLKSMSLGLLNLAAELLRTNYFYGKWMNVFYGKWMNVHRFANLC